jgi:hypothetical protein
VVPRINIPFTVTGVSVESAGSEVDAGSLTVVFDAVLEVVKGAVVVAAAVVPEEVVCSADSEDVFDVAVGCLPGAPESLHPATVRRRDRVMTVRISFFTVLHPLANLSDRLYGSILLNIDINGEEAEKA